MMIKVAQCLSAALLLTACPPIPPVTPPPDASDASIVHMDAAGFDACASACANLRLLACPEAGDFDACATACRHANGALTDLAPACVAKAATPAAVRACSPAWAKGCAGR